MTGPEHYAEAERLLVSCQMGGGADRIDLGHGETAESYPSQPDGEDGTDTTSAALAAAQVHATLALTAATARATGVDGSTSFAWHGATT